MIETLSVIKNALPYLLQGSLLTLGIVSAAMGIGLMIGLIMAFSRVYGHPFIQRLIGAYIWFFQGIPILVLLFLFYFGLFNYFELNVSAFAAVAIVLGLTTGAYQANIFRGAILSLPEGQFKAASALGMSHFQTIISIILPQILRISIPAWSNEFSIVLKDSALAFVIGAPEIMGRTQFVASRTYQHLPLYITAALIYFILTWTGVKLLLKLEKKIQLPGYAQENL